MSTAMGGSAPAAAERPTRTDARDRPRRGAVLRGFGRHRLLHGAVFRGFGRDRLVHGAVDGALVRGPEPGEDVEVDGRLRVRGIAARREHSRRVRRHVLRCRSRRAPRRVRATCDRSGRSPSRPANPARRVPAPPPSSRPCDARAGRTRRPRPRRRFRRSAVRSEGRPSVSLHCRQSSSWSTRTGSDDAAALHPRAGVPEPW